MTTYVIAAQFSQRSDGSIDVDYKQLGLACLVTEYLGNLITPYVEEINAYEKGEMCLYKIIPNNSLVKLRAQADAEWGECVLQKQKTVISPRKRVLLSQLWDLAFLIKNISLCTDNADIPNGTTALLITESQHRYT